MGLQDPEDTHYGPIFPDDGREDPEDPDVPGQYADFPLIGPALLKALEMVYPAPKVKFDTPENEFKWATAQNEVVVFLRGVMKAQDEG